MKCLRLLAALGPLFSPGFSEAQFFEKNLQPGFFNTTIALLQNPDNEDVVWVSAQEPQRPFSQVVARRLTAAGDVRTTVVAQGRNSPHFFDLLPLPGGGYVFTSEEFECDYFKPRLLYKVGDDGTIEWETRANAHATNETAHLLPGPGASFWLCQPGQNPVLYAPEGDSLGTAPFEIPVFQGYQKLPDGQILTWGADGLRKYPPALTSFRAAFSGVEIRKAVVAGGQIFVLTASGQLARLGLHLEILASTNLNPTFFPKADLAANADGAWILTADANPRVLCFDTALTLLKTVPIAATAPFRPAFLRAFAGRLVFAGDELHVADNGGSPENRVIALRSMPPSDLRFDAAPDAALVGLQTGGPPSVHWWAGMPGPGYPRIYAVDYQNVVVKIENTGATVLDAVTLNAVTGPWDLHCVADQHLKQKLTGLALPPGGIYEHKIGTFSVRRHTSAAAWPPQQELCFWTTLPNDSLDANPLNNRICQTQTLVDTPEIPASGATIFLFPNPVADVLRVSGLPFLETKYLIFNALGGRVGAGRFFGTGGEIEVSGLENGVCFLRLEAGGRVAVRRFVVAR